MKFAVVSHILPPSSSGQAMMLYRLLKDLSPDDYCLIPRQDYSVQVLEQNYSGRLPGKYYTLPSRLQITPHRIPGLSKWLRRTQALRVVSLGKQIADIMRREHCDAVIPCTGGLLDLPAAYLASRFVGAAFYPYMFDYYSFQWIDPVERFCAQRIEPVLVKRAAGIIVPNEFLRDELFRRYGVEATVIHNPCDTSEYRALPDGDESANNGSEIRIVYTGAVYVAQADAFRSLLAALDLLDRPNVKVHLYTAQPRSDLDEMGIRGGRVVCHPHQALSAMPQIQRGADILFLPLSFISPYPEVIRTSAPGKMGEYLAARRPVLVHAPSDSFVAWYFRHHQCGLVVDQKDPSALAEAIEQVLTDVSLRQELSKRAWEQAQTDFDVLVARRKFAELLKLDVPNSP